MFRTIVSPALFLSCLLQAADTEYEGYKSLKSIEAVGLEVSIADIGAQIGSIKKDLADQAATFLRQYGITPVSVEEARKPPGQPILRLSFVFHVDVKNSVSALQCSIALTQKVTVVRDKTIEAVEAKTWDNTGVTLIQPQYLKAASQDKLNDFLHQFVNDLYKANGKPSPFKKNPGEKAV